MTNSSIKNPSLGEGLGGLTLNEYQKQAMTTCMESSNNFSYMMLNLVGEVGEFLEKTDKQVNFIVFNQLYPILHAARPCGSLAKAIRRGEVHVSDFDTKSLTGYQIEELQKEAGDIMWQLFGLISVMGWDAEEIARQNLEKLKSRQQRNVIDGNGDNR